MRTSFTFTKAELEEASEQWRHFSWWRAFANAWAYIGFFAADVARRERALWS